VPSPDETFFSSLSYRNVIGPHAPEQEEIVKGLLHLSALVCLAAICVATLGRRAIAQEDDVFQLVSRNAAGLVRTVNMNGDGDLDLANPFFQDLGTNGRSCFTCHRPAEGWTITPQSVRERFDQSNGLDPIFRANDGSNCEGADISTPERRRDAFSLLLNRGLIRVGIDVPPGAEFVVEQVDDPYNCNAFISTVSMYRRPLPSTNLRFLSAVMWDGRESSPNTSILQDLAKQADDATTGHAQASFQHLTPQEAREIVTFETGLVTAQQQDGQAGPVKADGAAGGALTLADQPFFIGINDPVGLNPSGAPFNTSAFTLFDGWTHLAEARRGAIDASRRAIARGQQIFNTKPIVISGVAGLNQQTFSNGFTVPPSITGTCTTCHDSPNVGNHSVKAPLNIGLADAGKRTPDMPLYTLRSLATAERVQTTDPGRAMITGKWADIGKFKGPVLRGLAARAPYFHNGAASSLDVVVDFYEQRFSIGLTPLEKADLVAFLRAL
jgi:cytochrome c peroxidase